MTKNIALVALALSFLNVPAARAADDEAAAPSYFSMQGHCWRLNAASQLDVEVDATYCMVKFSLLSGGRCMGYDAAGALLGPAPSDESCMASFKMFGGRCVGYDVKGQIVGVTNSDEPCMAKFAYHSSGCVASDTNDAIIGVVADQRCWAKFVEISGTCLAYDSADRMVGAVDQKHCTHAEKKAE